MFISCTHRALTSMIWQRKGDYSGTDFIGVDVM